MVMGSAHRVKGEALIGAAGAAPLRQTGAVGRGPVGDVEAFAGVVARGEAVAAVGVPDRHPLLVGAAAVRPELDRDPVTCAPGAAGHVPSQRGNVAGDDLVVAAAGGLE